MEIVDFYSLEDLAVSTRSLASVLPTDIEVVVGVPRSGLLPATIIALQLNLPLTDLEGLLAGRLMSKGFRLKAINPDSYLSKPRNVLIVDDSSSTGRELRRVKSRVKESNCIHRITYAAIFVTESQTANLDFVGLVTRMNHRRIFEWNLFHSWMMAHVCLDIDGVLCEDPTPEENDDGEAYRKFVLNARVKFRPTVRVRYLVSSRLEKYRTETEQWLENNGIVYDEMFLIDVPDAATRRRLKLHAKHKAKVYSALKDAYLFIESEIGQADEIAKISGKNVICTANMQKAKGGLLHSMRVKKSNLIFRIGRKFRSTFSGTLWPLIASVSTF